MRCSPAAGPRQGPYGLTLAETLAGTVRQWPGTLAGRVRILAGGRQNAVRRPMAAEWQQTRPFCTCLDTQDRLRQPL